MSTSNTTSFFGASAHAKPDRLYHCVLGEPMGDGLTPRTVCEANGVNGTYLFATGHISKTLPFSFDKGAPDRDQEILVNGGIHGSDQEYAIIFNRDEVMNKPREVTVFSFSSDGFMPLGNVDSTRQYVSTKGVLFSETEIAFKATSAVELLSKGLQVFSLPQTASYYRAQYGDDFLDRLLENVDKLYQSGELIWENKVRGLSPDPKAERVLTFFAPSASLEPSELKP